jgi:hypothetical protein
MSSDNRGHAPQTTMPVQYSAGIDDIIILPLVLIALVLKKLWDALVSLLIHLMDWLFPILLQIMRFPLFTLRILGDACAALLRGIVSILPVPGDKRAAWKEAVRVGWAWLRSKISYKAFEEWLHHAFEAGMAWVFKKCKSLTPGQALLVLTGAVLWLPISFGVATAMHAVLFAKIVSWPAWMQMLHPVATVIAKSKLLVLPVYPAAWPQAKLHPFVQAMIRWYRTIASLPLMQKIGYRYRQIEGAAAQAREALRRAAEAAGLGRIGGDLLGAINAGAAWIGAACRAAIVRLGEGLSKVPGIGHVIARYAAHYDDVSEKEPQKLSEKVRGFYDRWSTKFTVEYYEAKEREEAAKGGARA